MLLSSNAFSNGETIPRRFTCDGQNLSPPLEWSGVPAQARSLVIICDDPNAPSGTWHHWTVYDVPPDRSALPEGAGQQGGEIAVKQGLNDFGKQGYGGPCPPHRHGPHHYHFRILALSVARLPLGNKPSCPDVERAARKHILAEASLVGLYER